MVFGDSFIRFRPFSLGDTSYAGDSACAVNEGTKVRATSVPFSSAEDEDEMRAEERPAALSLSISSSEDV